VLIEARHSVQCVVRGFLETSAHKSHRYISHYTEIFEKVAAYSPENTVLLARGLRIQVDVLGHGPDMVHVQCTPHNSTNKIF